jgi:peroxiredoxin
MFKKAYILIGIILFGMILFLFSRSKGSNKEQLPDQTQKTNDQVTSTSEIRGSFIKGEKAPEVDLVDFDGAAHLLSDFKGKAVIVDFWAGWCPFCVEEMPELQKTQDEFSEDLVIIGIHRTDTEKISTGLEFSQKQGVSYLLVSDKSGSLYRAAGGFGMPVAVFIDKQGKVVEIKSGPKTKEEIKEKVERLVLSE